MKTVLAISDYYPPAVRGGGAPYALQNIIAWLGGEFAFKVITHDFDLGDASPMPTITHGVWSRVGRAQVRYLSSVERLTNVIQQTDYGMIYLNSLFGMFAVQVMFAKMRHRIPTMPIMIAPHGELYGGALAQKRLKKRVFLASMKTFGAYKHILWHASTIEEAEQIQQQVGIPSKNIRIAPILSAPVEELPRPAIKKAGELKIIFLSRITPKKNLDGALRMLMGVKSEVQFDIYGTQEDSAYWELCESLMAQLPPNIHARYCGAVANGQIELFSHYHLFLFPTHGENFGYVIQEALLGGCLPLISQNTPWRYLADKRVGWDVANEADFIGIIEGMVQMDGKGFTEWSKNAQAHGLSIANDPARVEQNRNLFR
jgi:glycosyltransferase involved in cell wall biosynthesis